MRIVIILGQYAKVEIIDIDAEVDKLEVLEVIRVIIPEYIQDPIAKNDRDAV